MTLPASLYESVCAFRRGDISARQIAEETLAHIAAADASLHCFTDVTAQRALTEAGRLDAMRRRGERLPLLAGATYSVKNLLDIEGLTTLAGAKLHAGHAPAIRDAMLVRRMRDAGAMLMGAVNMDAYAYGFTTENTHYGITRNPRDATRVAGGSSGGSAAAVAAGMCHVSLGSDTNGSIRVPSSFCGTFGLKPTFGRLSRSGSYPFVPSLDHLGPFAGSARDLALVYDVLQGMDSDDPACAQREVQPALPDLDQGVGGLRIGILDGHFTQWADDDARAVVTMAANVLSAVDHVELREASRAREAAFIITASEAGSFYLDALRDRYADFEPLSRDRLMAGALLPAAWYLRAQRFRAWFAAEAKRIFNAYDLLIAPATPCTATPIGSTTITINGATVPTRPSIGLLTQPLSCIGLPVAVAPLMAPSGMPLGVQLIAAPWNESLCLRAAWQLERAGVTVRGPVTLSS